MERSSRTMASKNNSVSLEHGLPKIVIEIRETGRIGCKTVHARVCSHCPAKSVASEQDFGSWSIRRTWAVSVSLSWSLPAAAERNNSSSGVLAHRKYDSRVANFKVVQPLLRQFNREHGSAVRSAPLARPAGRRRRSARRCVVRPRRIEPGEQTVVHDRPPVGAVGNERARGPPAPTPAFRVELLGRCACDS